MGVDVDMTPMAPTVIGAQMVVPIRIDGRALVFDPVDKYAAYGGLADHGVEVSGPTISDVALSGNLLIITAAAPLSLRTVSYAMQAQDHSGALYQDGEGKGYAGHRGDIMEAAPLASYLVRLSSASSPRSGSPRDRLARHACRRAEYPRNGAALRRGAVYDHETETARRGGPPRAVP